MTDSYGDSTIIVRLHKVAAHRGQFRVFQEQPTLESCLQVACTGVLYVAE